MPSNGEDKLTLFDPADLCAFTITVVCKEADVDIARRSASEAAANASGCIMAYDHSRHRTVNSAELDDLADFAMLKD